MKALRITAALLLAFASGASFARAQAWVSIGPDGGPVVDFTRDAVSPTERYVSTGRAGVFHSTDGGENWTRAAAGLENRTTGPIAAAPGSVFVGTDAGLYRSVDQGEHWLIVSAIPAVAIGALNVDPSAPSVVYAGIRAAPGTPSLFRSADFGASWTATTNPSPRGDPIALDPTGATIYSGVFKSTDRGTTWARYGIGIDAGVFYIGNAYPVYPLRLVVDPRSPATLYAAAPFVQVSTHFWGGQIFRSDDGGTTFTPTVEVPGIATSVDVTPSGDVYAGSEFAGLFISRDRGGTWTAVPGAPTSIAAVRAGASAAEIVVGASSRGLWESLDGGASWASRNAGIRSKSVVDVALDPRAPTTIWAVDASVGGGITVSRDGGATWSEGGTGLPPDYWISSVAVDPADSNHVLVETRISAFGIVVVGGGGVFETRDGGSSWRRTGPGFWRVAFDPADPRIVYSTDASGIYRSADAGATWVPVAYPGQLPIDLAIDSEDPRFVYAGDLRSSDRGISWSPLGLSEATTALTVGGGGIVFASTASGVWKSLDHGATFALASAGLPAGSISTLAADRRRGIVYAASGGGLPPSATVVSAGIFASSDAGASWLPFTEDLAVGDVSAIAADSSAGILYAATNGGGLYRRFTSAGSCAPSPTSLCLGGGRFRAQASWKTDASPQSAAARPLTADAGAFWFFSANNLELVVKVVDGSPVNGKFWVFGAGLTDVEYELAITDTATGTVWRRANPQGQLKSFADTSAF